MRMNPYISEIRRSLWTRYAVGLGTFSLSTLLRFSLDPWMPNDRAYILFVPAALITTLLGGIGPGIVTAVLSGAAIWYFFLPPYRSFDVGLDGAVGIATYFVVVTIVLILVHRLQLTITQLKQEQERSQELAAREKLLLRELQHRTKNLFAVLHGLASRTLSGAGTLSEAREAFLGRLQALSKADQRLLNSQEGGVSLKQIIQAELELFAGQYSIEGEDTALDERSAQNFSLVLHELVTNAVKYGALSARTGHINVRWSKGGTGGSALRFTWVERGGPPVWPPARKGLGTVLIGSALGTGRLRFEPEGLRYEVEVTLKDHPLSGQGAQSH